MRDGRSRPVFPSRAAVELNLCLFIQPGNEQAHLRNTSLPRPSTSQGAYLFGQWWNLLFPSASHPSSFPPTRLNVNHYNDDKEKRGNRFCNTSCHVYHCFKENPSQEENKLRTVLLRSASEHSARHVKCQDFTPSRFCFFISGVRLTNKDIKSVKLWLPHFTVTS